MSSLAVGDRTTLRSQLFVLGDDHGTASVVFYHVARPKRSCLRPHETLFVLLSSTEGNVCGLEVIANLRPAMNQVDATVFYVDDNAKARRLLGDVLTASGFRVIAASDSLEARASWKRLRFDLALLDYRMPFLTGSQLAKEIKSSAPNVPVVLISGYTALAPSELLFVDAHFGRDTVLDDLLSTMWSLVRSNRLSAVDKRAARLWSNST
jgi:CheY-like chemotaxis protein